MVLCHGVFDLLHVGHIKYFEEAKKMGDVLVVTLTPDKYVNKGPHRPAFAQDLRAEALAALQAVDYVAVNEWPTAVETIALLKPDYYVKGPDYKKASDDRTGKIIDEKKAIEAVGGELKFTTGQTYSSTSLINNKLATYPVETREFLQLVRDKYSVSDIADMIEDLRNIKVLVVGEAIVDEYQYCEAIGKSSKEPTLVVKVGKKEAFLGGVLAIVNHVVGFAGAAGVVTQLGDRNSWQELVRRELDPAVVWQGVTRSEAPTIVKRRYIDSYFFTKLFETYEIKDEHMTEQDEARLVDKLEQVVSGYDMVIVADYGHGFFSHKVVQKLREKAVFLAVNVQSNAGSLGYQSLQKYAGADFFSIDETELRLEARDRRGEIEAVINGVGRMSGGKTMFVTRGSRGSVCWRGEQELAKIPAVAGKVVDRVGAGDAFLAVTALCASRGVPAEVMGLLGNIAGAMTVAVVGNKKPVRKLDLIRSVESLLK